MLKVGLIGFGKIGKKIYKELMNEVEFTFIYDKLVPQGEEAREIAISSVADLEKKCQEKPDMVIECAVATLLNEIAPIILKYTNLMAFSLTAFANRDFEERVKEICSIYHHRFFIPHGAILGLDGIFDAKPILESVKVTTTKKPNNLGLTNSVRQVVYDGTTRGACSAFPRNVNVHAALAVIGLGFDRTHSIIVSDPDSPGNTHNIEIAANGCSFTICVESTPGKGVTGSYTPVSAVSSTRRLLLGTDITIV